MRVLGFSDYAFQGRRLAQALSVPFVLVEHHLFPDGESLIRLPTDLPPQVILCRALDNPNNKLIELLLTAETARRQGVKRLTLVAPYLCYMRQDTAFRPGEAVSQRIVGRFLADLFDAVVTVDPHLHRVHTLAEAVPARRADALSAAPAMGRFLKERSARPLLVGPVHHVASREGTDASAFGDGYPLLLSADPRTPPLARWTNSHVLFAVVPKLCVHLW